MNRPWMIYWAVVVHVAWGLALLFDPDVTPAVILVGMHWIISLGVEGPWLGAALLLASGIALISLIVDGRLSNMVALALLFPQYVLLVAAFISDSQSVFSGILPDGRTVDRLLLFIALVPTMAAAVLHSLAIIERHSHWTRS